MLKMNNGQETGDSKKSEEWCSLPRQFL